MPEENSVVLPSCGEFQVPDTARHWSSWATTWPSQGITPSLLPYSERSP